MEATEDSSKARTSLGNCAEASRKKRVLCSVHFLREYLFCSVHPCTKPDPFPASPSVHLFASFSLKPKKGRKKMDKFKKKFIPSFILRAASRGKAYGGAGPRKIASSSTATTWAEDVDFMGVRKRPGGRYTAEIDDPYNNDCISLGTFDTAVEAAMAYDRCARSIHGSKATTNFIYGDQSGGPDSGGGDGGGSGGVGDDGGGDLHVKGTGGGRSRGSSGGGGNGGGGGGKKDASTLFFFDVGSYNQWRSNARMVKILMVSSFFGVWRRRHLNGGSLASFRCRNSSILSIGRGELTGEHNDLAMTTPCLLDGLVA